MSIDAAAAELTRPAIGHRVLDNGLEVVWEADRRQPLVAIEARIRGGLRGEGRYVGTGITHFIEHMLFKGTTTRAPGTIDQEVRRYGGTINAFTSFDTTGVSLFVEARYLNEALGMLADILQHAVFEPEEFAKERAVIISEIQMNLDDPDRRLHHIFWGRHFLEHPYRHPILGYRPLLEGLSVEDLRGFYAAQYQPQNIVVSVVGDLDPAVFGALAEETFGGWARGVTDPSQQLVPVEPPSASRKETAVEMPVQVAYVNIGFSSTALADPDTYPLDVLAAVLGRGRSSRLYERLVRQQRLADQVAAWNYTPRDPGVFGITLQTAPDKVDAAVAAVRGVLDEAARSGVSAAEVAKAKKQVLADYLFQRQSVESKANDLASSLTATGDPLFSVRYVEGVERVTPEAVQAALGRHWDPETFTTAVVRPASAAPAAAPAAADAPALKKQTWENGLTTLVGTDRRLPIAAIVLAYHGGVRVEEEPRQGISNLTAQMLVKGTARRNALQIAEAVESLGGSVEPFSGRDGFGLTMHLLAEDVPEGLALLHELATKSHFPEEELALQRDLIGKQLQAQEDEIFQVGGRLLRRTLFGSHPYRLNPLGTAESVERLTREDCLAFSRRWMTPGNAVLAIVGDVDEARVADLVRKTFAGLPGGGAAWPDRLPPDFPQEVRAATQAMPREQAVIMLGFSGTTVGAEDREALDVLTAVLSGMAGRLFQAVRETHGLSYTLGAVHVPGWDPGYLMVYTATRPDERGRVLGLLETELAKAANEGFSPEEVEQAKRYLIGQHRLDIQDLDGLARRAAIDELYGLGFDAWMSYEARIGAVTGSAVHDAARRYLTMQRRAQVIIGPNGHADSLR
jgi:zinc protease